MVEYYTIGSIPLRESSGLRAGKNSAATTMPDQTEEEVNTETVEPVIPETESEETETPTPASGEEQPTEESEEEAAKPDGEEAEESEEEAETETEVEEPIEEPTKKEPSPVEGETPREKALRLEVTRLRELNRGKKAKDLLGDVQPAASSQTELSEEDKKALEAYDPEQLSNLDKVIDIRIKQRGLVKKDDLSKDNYQSSSQDVLDGWLSEHPDYLPENDKGDILFNRLKEEINLYQKPANPRGWEKILNRAHNEIMGITTQPKVSVAQVQAKQEKIKVASHGPASGGPKKGEQMRKTTATPDVKAAMASGMLKGFDEADFS